MWCVCVRERVCECERAIYIRLKYLSLIDPAKVFGLEEGKAGRLELNFRKFRKRNEKSCFETSLDEPLLFYGY